MRYNKIDFSTYCPACGSKHTKACIDGGRCTAVGCGTMLSTFTPKKFSVKTYRKQFTVEAESAIQVRSALEANGYRIIAIESPDGPPKIRVIVCVSGGNVQGARASASNVEVEVLDYDNLEACKESPGSEDESYLKALEAEYPTLEHGVY